MKCEECNRKIRKRALKKVWGSVDPRQIKGSAGISERWSSSVNNSVPQSICCQLFLLFPQPQVSLLNYHYSVEKTKQEKKQCRLIAAASILLRETFSLYPLFHFAMSELMLFVLFYNYPWLFKVDKNPFKISQILGTVVGKVQYNLSTDCKIGDILKPWVLTKLIFSFNNISVISF